MITELIALGRIELGKNETRLIALNFVDAVNVNEILSRLIGEDDHGIELGVTTSDVKLVIVGTPVINTDKKIRADFEVIPKDLGVQLRIQAPDGVIGTTYQLFCVVLTSNDQTLQMTGNVLIV